MPDLDERRVLAQDRRLQLPQLVAGLETELVCQNGSRVPVALERLCLAIRPVQGEHQLSPQSLPQRKLIRERA